MGFIVFEGGEGVGKSTQIERLRSEFTKQGKICLLTREPGGTPFAEEIRGIFKKISAQGDEPLPLTELLLISAARAQHVQKCILPELEKGNIVLCDRFLDSTYVYQGLIGKIEKKIIDNISKVLLQNLIPDLTLVFVAPVEKVISRLRSETTRAPDRLDSSASEIHAQIIEGYKEVVNKKYAYPSGKVPERVLIDASRSVEEVFAQVKSLVIPRLDRGSDSYSK